MANDLDGEQIGLGAAKEAEQTGDLTGRAAVQNTAAGTERGARLAKGVARVALHILGAAHLRKPRLVLRRGMDGDKPRPLPDDAEDDAPSGEDRPRQRGEHPPRGTGQPERKVAHASGEAIGRGIGRAGPKRGADALAGAAADAPRRVDDRPKEPLAVRTQGDGLAQARGSAGRAPCAGLAPRQPRQRALLLRHVGP